MTDAIILVVFLSAAVERVVEALVGFAETSDEKKQKQMGAAALAALPDDARAKPMIPLGLKRMATIAAGFGIAAALCFGLDFQLINDFIESDLGEDKAKLLTAMLIGGGTAPAHEFIRYVEEKKKKAGNEAVALPAGASPQPTLEAARRN
jgi:hypothetical protein